MMAKDARLKEERLLLDAIGKVRAQKQRPNIERIYAIMQQQCRTLTVDEVARQLDNALKSRTIERLESKGGISYRDASMHRSETDKTNNCDLSALVMSAISNSVSGCTLEQLEKFVRKSLQPSDFREKDILRRQIDILCHKLVTNKHMLVRDGLYRLYESGSPLRTSAADSADCDDRLSSTTVSCLKTPSIRNSFCVICRREEDDNGSTTLISCADCSYSGHASCLKLSPNLARTVRMTRWQCYACKTCSACSGSNKKIKKPGDLLVCHRCDRGYHSECGRPPALAERASSDRWLCSDCCTDAVRVDADPYHYISGVDRRHRQYRSTDDHCVLSSNVDVSTEAQKTKFHSDTSCTSEAVVGSSSDVTKSRPRHASGDCAATSSSRQSSESLSPQSDSTNYDAAAKSSGAPRGLVDALSQYFTPSDKRRSRVSLNALPPHAVIQQPLLLDVTNSSRSIELVADTTRRDDCAPPSNASRSPLRNWKKARHLPNPSHTGSCSSNSNIIVSCPSPHIDAESTNSCEYSCQNLADSGTRLSVLDAGASVTSECSTVSLKNKAENTTSTGHHSLNDSLVRVRRLSQHFLFSDKRTEDSDDGAFNKKRKTVGSVESSTNVDDRRRSNSFSEMRTDSGKKRYRRTQLSALQDSLSHNFLAEGERKRTMRLTDYNLASLFEDQLESKRKRKNRSLSSTRQRQESSSTMDEVTGFEYSLTQQPMAPADADCNSSSSSWKRPFLSEPDIGNDDLTIFEASQSTNQVLASQEDVRLPRPITEKRTIKATFGSHRRSVSVSPTCFTDIASLESVNICERCLKVYGSYRTMSRHIRKCTLVHRMMGNEIYRCQDISVCEVDGSVESTYCHGLSLLTTVFSSDSKLSVNSSACDLTAHACLFYVMTNNTKNRCRLIGFFSKDVSRQQRVTLSELLILPEHRGFGYDIFLIDLSYKLNQLEGNAESCALPQSESTRELIDAYLSLKVIDFLIGCKKTSEITVQDIVSATGISSVEITTTLKNLNVLTSPIARETVEINEYRVAELAKVKKTDYTVRFEPSNLRLAPRITTTIGRCTKWNDARLLSQSLRENSQVNPVQHDVAFENDVKLSSSRRKVGRPKGRCGNLAKKSVEEKHTVKKRPGRPPKVKVSMDDHPCLAKDDDEKDVFRSTLSSIKSNKMLFEDKEDDDEEPSTNEKPCSADVPFPTDMPLLKRRDLSIADSDSDDTDRSPSPPTLEQVVSEIRDETNSIDRLSVLDADSDVLAASHICTKDLLEQITVGIDDATDDKVSVDESLSLDKSDIEGLETANQSNFDSFDELKASEDDSEDDNGDGKAGELCDDVFMGNSSRSVFSSVLNGSKKDVPEPYQLEEDDINIDRIEEQTNASKSVKDFSDSEADDRVEEKCDLPEQPTSRTPSLSSSDNESDVSLSTDDEDNNEDIKSIAAADIISKTHCIKSDLMDVCSETRGEESADSEMNVESKLVESSDDDGDIDERPDPGNKDKECLKEVIELNSPAELNKERNIVTSPLTTSPIANDSAVCELNMSLPTLVAEDTNDKVEGSDVADVLHNNNTDETVTVSLPVFKTNEDTIASSDPSITIREDERESGISSTEISVGNVAITRLDVQDNQFVQGLAKVYSARNTEDARSGQVHTSNLPNVVANSTLPIEPFRTSQTAFTFDNDHIKSCGELLRVSQQQQNVILQDADRNPVTAKSNCPGQFVPPSPMHLDHRVQLVASYSSSETDRRLQVTAAQQSLIGATHNAIVSSPGRIHSAATNANLFHSGLSSVSSSGCNAQGGAALRAGVSGQLPCLESNTSSYSTNYGRLSVGPGLPLHPTQPIASPISNTAEMGMPSPKHYYADFNMARHAGYSSMPPGSIVQDICYPTAGGAPAHTVKGSPSNYTEAKVASPASGCTLLSPTANTGRTHFNLQCRSPASRADQSSTSAGSSGYGNIAGGSSSTGSRQVSFNRPNPSPSSQPSKRNSGGNIGGSRLNQSPLEVNVFSPTPAAESSPALHLSCMSIPQSSVMNDVGLPFHFPSNNVVAVPVTATSYASIPSPTPRSLQLLSPSISAGAGNGIVSVGGYQRQGQHHIPTPQSGVSLQHRPSSANYQTQQQHTSALGLLGYNNVLPAPSSQATYAASRMLDQRFAQQDVDAYDQRSSAPVGRQSRNPRSTTASGQPPNCSLAKLQQLTNQLSESERVSQRQQAINNFDMAPYAMSMSGGPTMSMLLAQNVPPPGLADPLMSGIQMNNGAASVAIQQAAKPSGRRRTAGVSTNKSVVPPNTTAMPLSFPTNMAVAGYNMLGAFPHSSYNHGHQQTRPPSPLDYQHYFATNAAAAAAGFFNSGGSQLPMQMMHFGMQHTRAQVAAAAHAASGFTQSQPTQGGQVNTAVYPPYGYGSAPQDSFNNPSCR